MDATAEAIRKSLAQHELFEMGPLPGRTNHIKAGVLVPLVWEPQLCVLMTVRSPRLRIHPGDPCFPGGIAEPGDPDLLATALREAHEELGIRDPEVLGRLSSVPLYTSDHRIEPFVAALRQAEVTPCEDEVESVLKIPLADLLGQPSLDAIPWLHEGEEQLSPVFSWQGHLIYGATAHTLHELLAVVAKTTGVALPPLTAGRFSWQDAMPDFVAPWA
jgi:8-oxo-dGTP pyrophosphatase MutT (NUDIX family)